MTTTLNPADMQALADRFMGGIERGDIETVRDCYDPQVRVWLNTAGVEKSRDENLDVLAGLIAKTSARAYLERKVTPTPEGFVQTHVLHATHLSGPVLDLPAVLVCTVQNNRIVRLQEYFDSAPLMAWYAAIEAAA